MGHILAMTTSTTWFWQTESAFFSVVKFAGLGNHLLMKISYLVLAITLVLTGTFHGTSAHAAGKNPTVVISTSMGDITVQLDAKHAPISTKNFLKYVKAKHYDGTIFHRVIPNFMIQGGGMTADMSPKGGTDAPIKNEAGNGLKNLDGTIAMARTGVVNSATDQFFINVKDNGFLDHRDETDSGFGYAVFGKVLSGMDVVHKIENGPTAQGDVPVSTVTIKTIRLATHSK
jgi:peptidyl-prolyl cis-trans isomerase A (cyclophilin A)